MTRRPIRDQRNLIPASQRVSRNERRRARPADCVRSAGTTKSTHPAHRQVAAATRGPGGQERSVSRDVGFATRNRLPPLGGTSPAARWHESGQTFRRIMGRAAGPRLGRRMDRCSATGTPLPGHYPLRVTRPNRPWNAKRLQTGHEGLRPPKRRLRGCAPTGPACLAAANSPKQAITRAAATERGDGPGRWAGGRAGGGLRLPRPVTVGAAASARAWAPRAACSRGHGPGPCPWRGCAARRGAAEGGRA